jgi:Histidine kinase/GHKL domain
MASMNETAKYQDIFLKFITSKKWRIVRHLLLLVPLAITSYPAIDPVVLEAVKIDQPELLISALKKGMLAIFVISVFIIYLNLFVLVPRLLFKNKFLYYFITCMAIAVIFFIAEHQIANLFLKNYEKLIPELKEWSVKGFIDSVFSPLVFLAATTGYKVFKKWVIDSRQLSELKQAKIQEELMNLKSQINPHFLFNTLNNLNTLITTDAAKASAVVLGLSDVLRYHLYEADAEKVLLKKDIAILKQLLELEKLRRDNFQFSIAVEGEINGIMVPPFTFINFVDNAIKHSADNRGFSFITLDFTVTDGLLTFSCKNSVAPVAVARKAGGIGLQNIQRRLELMYGNAFTLNIENQDKTYQVTLILPV